MRWRVGELWRSTVGQEGPGGGVRPGALDAGWRCTCSGNLTMFVGRGGDRRLRGGVAAAAGRPLWAVRAVPGRGGRPRTSPASCRWRGRAARGAARPIARLRRARAAAGSRARGDAVGGALLLAFIVLPRPAPHVRRSAPGVRARAASTQTSWPAFARRGSPPSTWRPRCSGLHLFHGLWARAPEPRRETGARRAGARRPAVAIARRGHRGGLRLGADRRARGMAAMSAGGVARRVRARRRRRALAGSGAHGARWPGAGSGAAPSWRWSGADAGAAGTVIVVGAGLAGASAAATLSELGYRVRCLCFHDSPRRAHSVAAQGGINAAKNYQNDGDSVERLFHDTLEGGDFRARESNVYRLAELSRAHHRPLRGAGRAVRARVRRAARQPLVRRRAGVAHVLRARPDRPAAPARRLSGAGKEIGGGRRARAATARDARPDRGGRPRARRGRARPVTGRARDAPGATRSCSPPAATPTSSTSRPTPRPRTPPRSGAPTGAAPRSPTPASSQFHPTCLPASGRAPGQAHADVRVAAQRRPRLGAGAAGRSRAAPSRSPRASATTSSSASTRATATWRRATSPRARPRRRATRAAAWGPAGAACTWTSPTRVARLGDERAARALRQPVRDVRAHHRRRPAATPMRIYPARALHDGRALGRLRPHEHDPRPVRDRRGELLRSRRQPPGRERADAGSGRRLLHPAAARSAATWPAPPAGRWRRTRRRGAGGAGRRAGPDRDRCSDRAASAPPSRFHRALGRLLWERVRARRAARAGSRRRIDEVAALRGGVLGGPRASPAAAGELNQELERAGRVADFLELGELMCRDALAREESCGCHFRRGAPDGGRRGARATTPASPTWRPGSPRRPGASPSGSIEPLASRRMAPRRAELPMRICARASGARRARDAGGASRATRSPDLART